jgi:hypothetical protein
MRNTASGTGNPQELLHQAEMGHVGNDWNHQENEHRGNQYGKVMLTPFRDMEHCQNPTWTKINLHLKTCSKRFQAGDQFHDIAI